MVPLLFSKALVLLSQNPWYPLLPKAVTLLMDGPLRQHIKIKISETSKTALNNAKA